MKEYSYDEFSSGLHMDISLPDQSGNLDYFQYVNPQETDKQYQCSGSDQYGTLTDGIMTPPRTRADSSSRRPSLITSSTPSSCNAGLESASSATSFESSPGYPSSCPSSASSATSSRRHSTIYSDVQQSSNYLSVATPTPLFRARWPRQTWNHDQQPLPDSHLTDEQYNNVNGASYMVAGDAVTSNSEHIPFQDPDTELPWQRNALAHGMAACDHTHQTLAMDLIPVYNEPLATCRSLDFPQSKCESPQPSIFPDVFSSGILSTQSSFQSAPSNLEEVFEYQARRYDGDLSCSDEEGVRSKYAQGKCHRPNASARRRHLGPKIPKGGNICEECPKNEWGKPLVFGNRPEHLKRHFEAKHPEIFEKMYGYKKKEYPCVFKGCKKLIQARPDNYKAHYTKTHFSYGAAEKNGKNKRKSMKTSVKKEIVDKDVRWTMMLAGKMKMGEVMRSDTNKGQVFPSAWKMIGYSIKETRDIKVKDIIPDWQGPDDARLEKFDCRWKALKEGTLTYEQAMSVGVDMKESPRQGLLGVDMFETKAMGLARLDPRWKELQSGKMKPEDEEILGIASQVRRKR